MVQNDGQAWVQRSSNSVYLNRLQETANVLFCLNRFVLEIVRGIAYKGQEDIVTQNKFELKIIIMD